MAYANVQNSGLIGSVGGSTVGWTPGTTPSLNNLLTGRFWMDNSTTPVGSNCHDSSGTPKNFGIDRQATQGLGFAAGIYSLLVPSGFTTPIVKTAVSGGFHGIFDEWSGNVTTSITDTGAANAPAGTATSGNTGTCNSGANAGLALAVLVIGGSSATEAITSTGTSFTDDATVNNNSVDDAGTAASRTASVASVTGLVESWTWTDNTTYCAVLQTYNATGGAAVQFYSFLSLTGAM